MQTFYRLTDIYIQVVLFLTHKTCLQKPHSYTFPVTTKIYTEPSVMSIWTLLWHQENHCRLVLINIYTLEKFVVAIIRHHLGVK